MQQYVIFSVLKEYCISKEEEEEEIYVRLLDRTNLIIFTFFTVLSQILEFGDLN
jgi:hypothetical protein